MTSDDLQMKQKRCRPIIDIAATGERIHALRCERGITVLEMQQYLNLASDQAIYQWQRGDNLPCVDNLFAIAALLEVTVDDLVVYE